MPNGDLVDRESGTPQGAVVSPVLANLFLHCAFDLWMQREYPTIPFERYADDAICHCASEAQALELHQALEQRFAVCRPPRCLAWVVTIQTGLPQVFLGSAERCFFVPA
jgi:hypothetical protein